MASFHGHLENFQFGLFFVTFEPVKKIALLFSLICSVTYGQSFTSSNFGASAGLLFNMGTHQRSIGLSVKGYYADYFYQLNVGSTFTFNGLNYGNRKQFVESRTFVGAVLMAGKKNAIRDFEIDGLNHQTNYNYGIAYNYLIYWDNAKTSQLSGGWGLHIKNVSVRFENDVFGGQAKDRFRTGHLVASYKTENFKFTSGLYIWTGETRGSTWIHQTMDKCPSGYRNLEDLPYGKTSHGILYGGVLFNVPYGNNVHFRAGIDSENIRHAFQNRFTHDLILLPKKMQRNTPLYPRLDQNGCATFDKNDVRKDKLFLQFGSNDNWGN